MQACTSHLLGPQFPHLYIGHDGTCPDSLRMCWEVEVRELIRLHLERQSAPLTCQGTGYFKLIVRLTEVSYNLRGRERGCITEQQKVRRQ